jgi:hypothetical protein
MTEGPEPQRDFTGDEHKQSEIKDNKPTCPKQGA